MEDETPADTGEPNPWRFDSEKLDWNIVARPLLDKIAERRKSNAPQERIPVVIDLNFKFHRGLAAAKDKTEEFIETAARSLKTFDTSPRIDRRKRDLSRQYLFADLEADVIEQVASMSFYDETTVQSDEELERKFILRPLFMIWPDFEISSQTIKSTTTVKADAALRSFSADGSDIVWAVIDSGIDEHHPHFKLHENLELQKLDPPLRHYDFTEKYLHEDEVGSDPKDILDAEKEERDAALTDEFGHGTHVAGIIAGELYGDKDDTINSVRVATRRRDEAGNKKYQEFATNHIRGMAPKTKLVSFKVLNADGKAHVSNLIAAIAQIQEINEFGRWLKIHGVNLSVGYDFEPEWFACGQSPLCVEVDRLVKSGVVVVVAAGNTGYGYKQSHDRGPVASGMMMSINDPGNAELAITVGSTHREMPHIYGVSYFSSKGPTGDGRRKPDLVAPGERIISCATPKKVADNAKDPQNPPELHRGFRDKHGRPPCLRSNCSLFVHPPRISRAARKGQGNFRLQRHRSQARKLHAGQWSGRPDARHSIGLIQDIFLDKGDFTCPASQISRISKSSLTHPATRWPLISKTWSQTSCRSKVSLICSSCLTAGTIIALRHLSFTPNCSPPCAHSCRPGMWICRGG
ncbi:S8 family serine peptidase [Litoreibacter sp.]|nr:S8 family serine peptidase [Litoreibacter sp.]